MYYGFIDGKFAGASNSIKHLKNTIDEDIELFNGFSATIYKGCKSECFRFYNEKWHLLRSLIANRPTLPDWYLRKDNEYDV